MINNINNKDYSMPDLQAVTPPTFVLLVLCLPSIVSPTQ